MTIPVLEQNMKKIPKPVCVCAHPRPRSVGKRCRNAINRDFYSTLFNMSDRACLFYITYIYLNVSTSLTVGGGEEALVDAAGLVGELLGDVHVRVHLVPDLLQRGVQVGLPVALVQAVNQLSQLHLGAVVPDGLVLLLAVLLTGVEEGSETGVEGCGEKKRRGER